MTIERRSRPRRSWIQRICILFLVITCIASALSAALLAYAKDTVSSIPRTAYGNILTQEDGDAEFAQNSEEEEDTPQKTGSSGLLSSLVKDAHVLKWRKSVGRKWLSRLFLYDSFPVIWNAWRRGEVTD
mgnify:CR=1 FL=1